jgi:hypothetical protein
MPEYDRNEHFTPDYIPGGKEGCPVVGYQSLSVSVPVEVKPFARTGKTRTVCCCDPIVTMDTCTCAGKKDGTCHFTISQMLCIEVPVNFGAVIGVGDTFVDCLGASSEAFPAPPSNDCCCD